MTATAHGSLTANTVKTVQIDSGRGGIVIVNRDQQGIIWVRIDGVDPQPETAGTYAVFGAREFALTRNQQAVPIDVRMVSDVTRKYSVEAY